MAKAKKMTAFFCQECGFESSKWTGQCPQCRAWNSMVEEPVSSKPASGTGHFQTAVPEALKNSKNVPVPLSAVSRTPRIRIHTGFPEMDRVLGGGIVKGSLVLLGGDPGIGKSTLLLQTAANLAGQGEKVLYVSGEESLEQIALRAERIGGAKDSLKFFCETDLEEITAAVAAEKPALVVIDSIQTMFSPDVQSAPGSVSQIRETTGLLLRIAKESGIAFFIIGHVTKDGSVAGPRILEHMVDTVLYFEGDRYASYRILRGVKNRFGSTNEIGIFEMLSEGLREVEDPSGFMLSEKPASASGAVVTCVMEGTRPILTEVQALVTRTSYGFPKRQAAGVDINRAGVLLAVMEKHMKLPLSQYDAYISLAGGLREKEPALDLGIVLALLSGLKGRPVPEGFIVFGEVGLSGEVRSVGMAAQRIREAVKMGYRDCILPGSNIRKLPDIEGIRLHGISRISELFSLFENNGEL